MKGEECEATLQRAAIDGTFVVDLTEYLTSLKGKIVPPADLKFGTWQVNPKVGFRLDEGSTQPPHPCRGRTSLAVGEDYGEVLNTECAWRGGAGE